MARNQIRKEADRRKKLYDAREKVQDHALPIGSRVYIRKRVQGRNKIQDAWGTRIFKIIDRPGNEAVYKIIPVDGFGAERTVNRVEIKPCLDPHWEPTEKAPDQAVDSQSPEHTADETTNRTDDHIGNRTDHHVNTDHIDNADVNSPEDESSSDDLVIRLDNNITSVDNNITEPISEGQDSDHSTEDGTDNENDAEIDTSESDSDSVGASHLRRSSRVNFGHHTNLHRLPRSVVRE